MNVVDSSAWLADFAGTRNATAFAGVIEQADELVVPTLSLFEVFKRVLVQRGETDAFRAVSIMRRGSRAVPLDAGLAIAAAHRSSYPLSSWRPASNVPLAGCQAGSVGS